MSCPASDCLLVTYYTTPTLSLRMGPPQPASSAGSRGMSIEPYNFFSNEGWNLTFGNCYFSSVPNFLKIHFSLDNTIHRVTVSPRSIKLGRSTWLSEIKNLARERKSNPLEWMSEPEKSLFQLDCGFPITGGLEEKGAVFFFHVWWGTDLWPFSKTNLPLGRILLVKDIE